MRDGDSSDRTRYIANGSAGSLAVALALVHRVDYIEDVVRRSRGAGCRESSNPEDLSGCGNP